MVDLTPAFPWGPRWGDRETNNSRCEDERLSLLSGRPLIRTASRENESQSREAARARPVKQPRGPLVSVGPMGPTRGLGEKRNANEIDDARYSGSL